MRLAIVSEEGGIAVPELTDDNKFADIVVNIFLFIITANRLREELGLEQKASFSLFLGLPTFKDLKAFMTYGNSKGEFSEDLFDFNNKQSSTTPFTVLEVNNL